MHDQRSSSFVYGSKSFPSAVEIFDARKDTSVSISMINVFYVVHQVMVKGVTSYLSTLIAADGFDDLRNGLFIIQNKIFVGSGEDERNVLVYPIFIRNLEADSAGMALSCEECGISVDLGEMLSVDPSPLRYVVLGLMIDNKSSEEWLLQDVRADSATGAFDCISAEAKSQVDRTFIPLFSAMKTPTTERLMEQYSIVFRNVSSMLDETLVPQRREYMH